MDFVAWITAGKGLGEQISGSQPALLGAVAHHLAWMPLWAFCLIVVLAVVVLSALIALLIVSAYKKELIS